MMDRVFDGLTFHEFNGMEFSPRSNARITKGDVVVGWRHDRDARIDKPEKVVAVGRCPDIQKLLDAAYAKFLAAKKSFRAQRDADFSAEAAVRYAARKMEAREAMGLPSPLRQTGGASDGD